MALWAIAYLFMRRVLVIGPGGSGKSTVSVQIGELTGLPVVHLDALYWQPGWVPMPQPEWRQTVAALAAGDRWVLDGNYGGSLDIRLPSCDSVDSVVFMDVPRYICIIRIVWRWLRYVARSRPEMGPGCPERLTWDFLLWIWNYPRRRRPDEHLRRLAALPPDHAVHVLRSRRDVARFLMELQQRSEA